jgi:hypothetical protein
MSQTTEIYDKTLDAAQLALTGCSPATLQKLDHQNLETHIRSLSDQLTAGKIDEEEAMLRARMHGALAGLKAFFARGDRR